jgi:cytoskeleton protein RodZ
MMERLLENNIGQDGDSTAVPGISLGRTLREARERLGLSLAEVAGQIKFAPRQIEALEADDYKRLPEMAFVRGFVRSYARILQLDPQSLLALLPQQESAAVVLEPASVEVPFPRAHAFSPQNLIWMGAALVLAVLVVVFAVWHYKTPQPQAEGVPTQTAIPMPAEIQVVSASAVPETAMAEAPVAAPAKPAVPEPAPTPVPAKPSAGLIAPQAQSAKPAAQPGAPLPSGALRLTFDDESWVEVRDKSDRILSSQVNPRGSELRLDGHAPLSLVIGHASTAHLYYRGKQVGLAPYINSTSDTARLTLE